MESFKLDIQHPTGRELLGGDLLAQSLQRLGVDVIFGLHGGHLDAFLMGCVDIGIELIDTRHETVAVQAAEGYAKVSGKTGCCFVTANSGFCNGLPGLATAFADRSPVLCVTSSPPLRDAETNALQGFHDQVVLAKPVTKFAHRFTTPLEIPRIVSLAWRTASSGAPGPVLLDFPIDILFTPVDDLSRVAWGNITAPAISLPGPDPTSIKKLAELIRGAARPAIIVGTGARGAVDEIVKLAETASVPIFHSPKFSTGIPASYAFNAGSASHLALLAAGGKPQPDVLVLLGARTGFIMGGRSGAIVPTSNCQVVQIDIDGGEIGRSEHVSLGIVSDIRLAIAALNAELAASGPSKSPEAWIRTALSLRSWRAPHNESQPKLDQNNGHLHPYHAVKKLLQTIPSGSIISIDGGEAGGWTLQLLPEASASLSMVSTGYLGFLGNGWGYSLGAAVADRSKLVVNIQGDGSAGFHLAELDSYKKFNLRILTVVVNNVAWGMSQAGQAMIYGENSARPASTLRADTRFDIIAQGFGIPGLLVDATDTLPKSPLAERRKSWLELGEKGEDRAKKALSAIADAVDEIVQSRGPGLIDLRVSPHPYQDTTKAMVGATPDPNVIVVPYYDNLPRPYYRTSGANGGGAAA